MGSRRTSECMREKKKRSEVINGRKYITIIRHCVARQINVTGMVRVCVSRQPANDAHYRNRAGSETHFARVDTIMAPANTRAHHRHDPFKYISNFWHKINLFNVFHCIALAVIPFSSLHELALPNLM